jgi:hypothetical protein
MKNKGIISDTWLTPADFYLKLAERFSFSDFDPCPPDCDLDKFDGLKTTWADRTFCNPPYSRKLKEHFILKALAESRQGKLVVLLLPASTGTMIFHEVILPYGTVEFIRGRLLFEVIDSKGNHVNPGKGWNSHLLKVPKDAPKLNQPGQNDSMLVIFDSPR